MSKFREHVKNHINAQKIIVKLLKQYDISNIITVNLTFQKICRFNMKNFFNIFEYAKHIQRNYNKIFQIDKKFYL